MIRFLIRRILTLIGILLALSIMMYAALATAMDPLDNLRQSTASNKQQLINDRIQLLHLDKPWYWRYWHWLGHFVQGDFGSAWATSESVNSMLPGAVATSFRLVIFSTVMAIIIGVGMGVVTALRQYSGFDYATTFVSFVLYSLPVFWIAVMLKQYLAIGANNFLMHPHANWPLIIVLSVLLGLFWMGALGGEPRRKAIVFACATAISVAVFAYIFASGWLTNPTIGIIGVGLVGLAMAVGVTLLLAGLNNRRALYSALTVAVVGIALYYPLQSVLAMDVAASWWFNVVLLLVALAVGALVGWLFGGPDRMVSVRGGMLVALVMSAVVFIDQVLQYYSLYYNSRPIAHRPIATSGPSTPALGGGFWVQQLDSFTHLLLPTISLVLISFASYTRYQRGSMLEVLNMDYMRTARAKGLPERTVIVRHGLRNALMPLASIIPVDFAGMIGGAVITETIFNWYGMGRMFITAMQSAEIDPAMMYIMITGAAAVLANLLADILYAVLDPRIRVDA